MATLRLTSAPRGARAVAAPAASTVTTASPLTSQLWLSRATPNNTGAAVIPFPSSPKLSANHPFPAAPAVASVAVAAAAVAVAANNTLTTTSPPPPPPPPPGYVLAHDRPREGEIPKNRYFNPSNARLSEAGGEPGKKPGDENKANLGKTLRILQDHLPTVLQSPLPQEIIAPNVSLHLFPTTHPHLPTVTGRVAYTAALWSAPIAWNRLPIVGNVRLSIISERITKQPLHFAPSRAGALPEQLVVRWCTPGSKKSASSGSSTTGTSAEGAVNEMELGDEAFTGLFVFQFDTEGRILSHTIETVQEGGDWEKGVGAKVVGLTDWLLGGMRRGGDNPSPAFEGLNKEK